MVAHSEVGVIWLTSGLGLVSFKARDGAYATDERSDRNEDQQENHCENPVTGVRMPRRNQPADQDAS
jgi:hypothetical protein